MLLRFDAICVYESYHVPLDVDLSIYPSPSDNITTLFNLSGQFMMSFVRCSNSVNESTEKRCAPVGAELYLRNIGTQVGANYHVFRN